jgi:predicted amidohydrolase
MRVAAIQLEPRLADVPANLEASERLADAAGAAGAEWIVLPEFFTTGVAFVPELADAALRPDGEATGLMLDLARRHGATVGGSFLCRDADGNVRNAWHVVTPDGVAGRHDKDLPTMWENAFYVPGDEDDDGVIDVDGRPVGIAMCWELMRTQTARRLRERVDVVLAGSNWWSLPRWRPHSLMRRREAANERQATGVAPWFARYVGAPVAHAAMCGPIECRFPGTPLSYRGHLEGGASITDGRGRVLARRDRREGPGFVVADVDLGRVPPSAQIPDRFWLHRRDPIAAYGWSHQKLIGRPWYRRHVAGRPPLVLANDEEGAHRAVARHAPS